MTMGETTTAGRRWVISPGFDLLFLINIWWLIALLPTTRAMGITLSTPLDFWQVYFLTTPHRWLTLLLVATDPDRRRGQERWFVGIAGAAAAAVLVGWLWRGAFDCLILADFVWNAWHFASQHGGILRIYGRMAGGGRPRLETRAFRVFVTYTALRTAGALTGWTEDIAIARTTMLTLDYLVLVLPVLLVGLELANQPWQRPGKVLYLVSVVSMYTVLLWAIRTGQHQRVVAMAVATAAFHAVEYLAIVTFYAWRRQELGSDAPFRRMARQWLHVLLFYVVFVGLASEWADRHWKDFFVGLNLWAAFLHYAYDGMIWKLRRPETAQALNVQLDDRRVSS